VFSPVKHRLVTTHYLAVMVKCLSATNLLHSVPAFVLFSMAKGSGLAIAERNPAYFVNPLLAFRDVLMQLSHLTLRRRDIQRSRVAPDRQVLRSEGFGLFDSPRGLLRVFKQGRRLKHRLQPGQVGNPQ
jgi:hypothetical protein